MKVLLSVFITTLISFGAGGNKELAETYINNYKDVAIQEMQRTGIPASIKLAQGLLESDWGRSDLAKTANNHFGIKCGGKWDGGTFYKEDDDKDARGKLIESCFRSFASPIESYMAHSDFLTDPRKEYRYGFLFNYKSTDYKSWAKGLKKSGYATDPAYPKKLIKIIEMYDLDRFDKGSSAMANNKPNREEVDSKYKHKAQRTYVLDDKKSKVKPDSRAKKKSKIVKTEAKKVKKEIDRMPAKHVSRLAYSIGSINKTRKVTAKGGESLNELARAVGLSIDEILEINDTYTTKEELLSAGDYIYIEKKKRSYRGSVDVHVVKKGETMESIAQKYGMRLKSLYAKNRMPKNSKTMAGVKLHLTKSASLSERPKFKLTDSRRKHNFLFEDDDTVK